MVTLLASESIEITDPRYNGGFRRQLWEKLGWSFHLPLCKEWLYPFLCNCEVTCIQMVYIHFGSDLVTRQNIEIVGYEDFLGNIRLHGSFHSQNIKNQSNIIFLKPTGSWKKYVKNTEFIKSRKSESPDWVFVFDVKISVIFCYC